MKITKTTEIKILRGILQKLVVRMWTSFSEEESAQAQEKLKNTLLSLGASIRGVSLPEAMEVVDALFDDAIPKKLRIKKKSRALKSLERLKSRNKISPGRGKSGESGYSTEGIYAQTFTG